MTTEQPPRFRVKAHWPDFRREITCVCLDWDQADRILRKLVSSICSGGHIEQRVDGIGWVLCNERPAEE